MCGSQRCPHSTNFAATPRLASQGFRRAVIKHYIMIYEIDEQEKAVLIHRFFYAHKSTRNTYNDRGSLGGQPFYLGCFHVSPRIS